MRHERQVLIPGWDQAAIERAAVGIVGAGAIGSALAPALVRLGAMKLKLLDQDVLEDHNLENQAYDRGDLNKPKVQALAERLWSINPDLEIEGRVGTLEGNADWLYADFLFGCVDNRAARELMSDIAVEKKLVLIDGGIEGFVGQVMTVIPGKTACHGCLPSRKPAGLVASCSSSPIPSTYLTASTIANLQAVQFLRLLREETIRSLVQIDLWNGAVHNSDLAPNPQCEICGGA